MKNLKYFYYIIPFIGFFTLVNAIFVYISKETHSGSVQTNSYKIGQKYNAVLEHYDKQKNLPFTPEITVKLLKDNKVSISAYINDKKVKNVEGKILRPVTDKFDKELSFQKKGKYYISNISLENLGSWEVIIRLTYEGEQYFFEKRFFLEKDSSGK